jgi:putative FmdB family regulatory protein
VPMYEYQCKSCKHRFEVIQKFSDKPVKKCPKCGKAVERLVSSSAIQFKGTGWYVTDYAKRSGSADRKSESKTEKDASKDTSKESGPAAAEKSEKPKETGKSSSPASPKNK